MKALRYMCIFICFLTTSCFSESLFEKVCADSYDICVKKCDRDCDLCKIGSAGSEADENCENQFKAEDSPCMKKCTEFKEDCGNKADAAK